MRKFGLVAEALRKPLEAVELRVRAAIKETDGHVKPETAAYLTLALRAVEQAGDWVARADESEMA